MSPGEKPPHREARKTLLAAAAEAINRFTKDGAVRIRKGHYEWNDSPLDDRDHTTSAVPFAETFDNLLPQGVHSLREFVEDKLGEKKGSAIGIEFGGIGTKLFAGFSEGTFARSLGVTLVDHRTPHEIKRTKEGNERRNHTVLEGDVFDSSLYDRLEQELQGKKVDFIVERMARGLEFTPLEPYTLMKTLQTWYRMLSDEGMMLVQVPRRMGPLLTAWTDMLAANHPELEVKSFTRDQKDSADSAVGPKTSFYLKKLKGAPAKLPELPHKTVEEIGILPFLWTKNLLFDYYLPDGTWKASWLSPAEYLEVFKEGRLDWQKTGQERPTYCPTLEEAESAARAASSVAHD